NSSQVKRLHLCCWSLRHSQRRSQKQARRARSSRQQRRALASPVVAARPRVGLTTSAWSAGCSTSSGVGGPALKEGPPQRRCGNAKALRRAKNNVAAVKYEGIDYVVRASLGHNQWVVLIYYPDNAEGNAATFNFEGPKHEAGAAARRRI